MAKAKTVYFCKECGYESSGWLGKCPNCGEWNSFVEEKIQPVKTSGRGTWVASHSGKEGRVKVLNLDEVNAGEEARDPSGISELDRVLGGGFVKGSFVLVGGDPGIGKSTLLLQTCDRFQAAGKNILYVSGEESPSQIRMRADRLGVKASGINLLASTDFHRIEEEIVERRPEFVVIDSIQTIYMPELASAPGSVSQVRECAAGLLRLAKSLEVIIVLVGHVTKEGAIAGPRVLEHMVDTVLYFEGDGQHSLRMLRCVKNRFGNTDELGLFEMRREGLISVADPSQALLAGRPLQVPGTVVTAIQEGSRTLLMEIQALVSPSAFAQALRTPQGIERMRLSMLLAVLQKNIRQDLSQFDIYLNVAGGMKIKETGADLAVLAAIFSSLEDRPLRDDLLVFGEIGLAGEVRSVSHPEKRVQDAARLGWKRFLLPSQAEKVVSRLELAADCEVYYISLVKEAMDLLFQ